MPMPVEARLITLPFQRPARGLGKYVGEAAETECRVASGTSRGDY